MSCRSVSCLTRPSHLPRISRQGERRKRQDRRFGHAGNRRAKTGTDRPRGLFSADSPHATPRVRLVDFLLDAPEDRARRQRALRLRYRDVGDADMRRVARVAQALSSKAPKNQCGRYSTAQGATYNSPPSKQQIVTV